MVFPYFVNATTNTSSASTSLELSVPAGAAVGDVLVAGLAAEISFRSVNDSCLASPATLPSGWVGWNDQFVPPVPPKAMVSNWIADPFDIPPFNYNALYQTVMPFTYLLTNQINPTGSPVVFDGDLLVLSTCYASLDPADKATGISDLEALGWELLEDTVLATGPSTVDGMTTMAVTLDSAKIADSSFWNYELYLSGTPFPAAGWRTILLGFFGGEVEQTTQNNGSTSLPSVTTTNDRDIVYHIAGTTHGSVGAGFNPVGVSAGFTVGTTAQRDIADRTFEINQSVQFVRTAGHPPGSASAGAVPAVTLTHLTPQTGFTTGDMDFVGHVVVVNPTKTWVTPSQLDVHWKIAEDADLGGSATWSWVDAGQKAGIMAVYRGPEPDFWQTQDDAAFVLRADTTRFGSFPDRSPQAFGAIGTFELAFEPGGVELVWWLSSSTGTTGPVADGGFPTRASTVNVATDRSLGITLAELPYTNAGSVSRYTHVDTGDALFALIRVMFVGGETGATVVQLAVGTLPLRGG